MHGNQVFTDVERFKRRVFMIVNMQNSCEVRIKLCKLFGMFAQGL